MVAGLGYLVDSFGGLLSKSYDANNVAGFTFAGAAVGYCSSAWEVNADVAVAGLDEAALVGDDDLGAVAQAELGQDARHV